MLTVLDNVQRKEHDLQWLVKTVARPVHARTNLCCTLFGMWRSILMAAVLEYIALIFTSVRFLPPPAPTDTGTTNIRDQFSAHRADIMLRVDA